MADKRDKSIYELDGIKLGQLFQIKKQTEFEKLPLDDGFWIVAKLIYPHVASSDRNSETDPAFLAVWADSYYWRGINDSVKEITVKEFNKMGNRAKPVTIGEK